eukprot:TRINITY_DN8795_c0_g1_i1.p1 TRINITY_DN8795_c0_g1~~TRINITY_DN8795_c0_g1_i1.p1  ORF type:complete len:193 (-),score=17.72 TRINITY_DN8795_c0_g1_i1:49-627(-)
MSVSVRFGLCLIFATCTFSIVLNSNGSFIHGPQNDGKITIDIPPQHMISGSDNNSTEIPKECKDGIYFKHRQTCLVQRQVRAKTRREANAECLNSKGQLPSLLFEYERVMLQRHVSQDTTAVWTDILMLDIGVFKDGASGKLVYIGGSYLNTSPFWCVDEPSFKDGCVAFVDGCLSSLPCSYELPVFCELSL